MKYIKKMMVWAIAMVILTGAINMTVFADPAATDYQIKIDNAVAGETYSAYKVFDVTYANPVETQPTVTPETDIPGSPDQTEFHLAYSYTISTDSLFWNDLITGVTPDAESGVYSLSAYGLKFVPTTTTGVYNVMPIDETGGVTDAQAQALAAFLATKTSEKTPAASDTATAQTDEHDGYKTGLLTLNVGLFGAGYYFVDTTTGSLCSLDTTEPTATIREKNSLPTETKTVSDAADGTFGEDATVKIGDTAYFKIEVTDSKGTDKKITVHDEMDSMLTLDLNSFAIKVDGTDVASTNYTIKYSSTATVKNAAAAGAKVTSATLEDDCTFEIEFTDAYIQSLDENKVIVITYEAELNENASTATPFQVNTSRIQYSAQTTVDEEVTVKTYEADVVKTDAQNKLLDGATFALYDAATGGNKYDMVQVTSDGSPVPGKYRFKVSTDAASSVVEKMIPDNGKLTIIGLENGTYYLEEVDHPEGYNPLTARKDFTVADANNNATINGTTYTSGGVHIINNSGTELPSTGGIGTTIFYIVGAILVVVAGVLLVTRRRMKGE